MNYSRIINTRKLITNYSGRIYLSENYNSRNYEAIPEDNYITHSKIIKNNFTNLGLKGKYNSDWYYSENSSRFYKYGGSIDWEFNHKKQYLMENDSVSIDFSNFSLWDNIGVSFNVGHGHGRVEYVEDAITAIYILNSLSENGVLSRDFEKSDIKKLADKITSLNNERYYDYRLFRQKSMKELSVLILKQGLVNENSIDVYNVIADYHYYANIPVRESGSRFFYFAQPSFNKSYTYDADMEDSDTRVGIGLNVRYENYYPIDVKWQRNFNIDLRSSHYKLESDYRYKSNEYDNEYRVNHYQMNTKYEIGYYPSTRSNLNIYVLLRGSYMAKEYEDDDKQNTFIAEPEVGMDAYYYLSERLRVNASFSVNYLKYLRKSEQSRIASEYEYNNNDFNQYLSANLTYFIF